MGRLAAKSGFAVAALLLVLATPGLCAERGGPGDRGTAGPEGKGPGYRLDEVRIVGSAERPAVLFFLPRSRFRLGPVRTPDLDVKNRLLMDDKALRTGE